MKTQKKRLARFNPKQPSIAAIAADLVSRRCVSIHEIATEAMRLGAAPLVHGEGKVADKNPTGYAIAADAIMGLFDVHPILDTVEKLAAFSMRERDGCFDSWPDGQENGEAVYESILWIPNGAEPITKGEHE